MLDNALAMAPGPLPQPSEGGCGRERRSKEAREALAGRRGPRGSGLCDDEVSMKLKS